MPSCPGARRATSCWRATPRGVPTHSGYAIKIDQSQILVLSAFSEKLGYAYFVPVDHLGGQIYEFLYALNIFNSF